MFVYFFSLSYYKLLMKMEIYIYFVLIALDIVYI